MSKFVLFRGYYGYGNCGLKIEHDIFDTREDALNAMINEFDKEINERFQLDRKGAMPFEADIPDTASLVLTDCQASMIDDCNGQEFQFEIEEI